MSTGTEFGDILSAAIHGGYVAHLTDQTYTISSPIVIHVDSTIQGALGIDGGGATLVSQVTDGSPLIRIVVDPGVDFRYLTLSNFTLQGTGSDGNGIEIVADGNDRWAYNWTISDVAVHGVGGYGLSVVGSAFEGLVSDSWMNNNALGGVYFSHSANGGVASALRWFGGGAQDNGGAGIMLDNGTRDLGVEGALFANNAGAGISALSGITAVSDSSFENNGGAGIAFQNYGNFSDNVFSTSGRQTVGIDGYLAGTATLVGNSGSALADLDGSGVLYMTGNDGAVVTGPSLVPNAMGGDMAHVTTGTAGVALPTLAPITAATTAAKASSTGTGALESALQAAIADGYVAHLTDATYTVTTPIVINVTRSSQGPVGIDLGGAKIFSQITDGSPVIEIIVAPGVDFGGLTLGNFSILGNGGEGDGIKIVADGADRSLHDWTISNVNVEHVGGIGLDVLGNVSQGTVFNSWMHDDAQGGARFADSVGGGEVNSLAWLGGGVRKNGVAGLILDNGARDLSVNGAYFVDNDGPGLMAPSGITSVRSSGFENNLGSGAIVLGAASFADDTFATYGRQATAIGSYLTGDLVTLTGVGSEYYGVGPDPTVMANVQGSGTLAIAGAGNVMVGPDVAVTGALPTANDGDNTLIGTPWDDVIHGLGGNDILIGEAGADQLDGGSGLDIASYRDATLAVVASLANPALNTGDAAGDSYHAIEGLEGSPFDDNLTSGGNGNDVLAGLGGNDTYVVSAGDSVFESAGAGQDLVLARTSFALGAGQSIEKLYADATGSTAPLDLTGNEQSQAIMGNQGQNRLDGGGGTDILVGLGGDDTYLVSAGDRVFEGAGAGQDLVLARTGFVLEAGQSIEKLYADATGSTAPLDLTGNEQSQAVMGNQGQNRLDGGGGPDILVGLGGDDTYLVSAGDRMFESAGAGQDLVLARTSFVLEAGQSIEKLYADATGSTGPLDLTGNEQSQIVMGNQGNNRLDGGGGPDILVGLGGADTFSFSTEVGPGNVDTIHDFVHGTDMIQLSADRFGMPSGALAADQFKDIASGPLDAGDRIVYDGNTGDLFFDADGNGDAASVKFAVLSGHAILAHTDFIVV